MWGRIGDNRAGVGEPVGSEQADERVEGDSADVDHGDAVDGQRAIELVGDGRQQQLFGDALDQDDAAGEQQRGLGDVEEAAQMGELPGCEAELGGATPDHDAVGVRTGEHGDPLDLGGSREVRGVAGHYHLCGRAALLLQEPHEQVLQLRVQVRLGLFHQQQAQRAVLGLLREGAGGAWALRDKLRLARSGGWVSADDAMYWALRVLCEHPWVAAAITQRFDEILVDEAQDTSEVQMACLRKFHQTGTLRSLTLVGDLDQSIASYNGAVPPAGCDNLARDRGLHPHRPAGEPPLLPAHLRRHVTPCTAATVPTSPSDPTVAAPGFPSSCSTPADDPAATVDPFRTRLAELGEGPQDAAILARTNDLAQAINGSTSPARMEKALAIARLVNAQRNATLGRHDLDRLDRTLAVLAWGGREDLAGEPADTRWALRKASMALLTDAPPPLKGDLGSWVTALRRPLADAVALLTDRPPRHTVATGCPSPRQCATTRSSNFSPARALSYVRAPFTTSRARPAAVSCSSWARRRLDVTRPRCSAPHSPDACRTR